MLVFVAHIIQFAIDDYSVFKKLYNREWFRSSYGFELAIDITERDRAHLLVLPLESTKLN